MKKVILILCVLMLLPTTALAHTSLENSSPKDMETVVAPLTEIVLTFNTDIEQLSTISLSNQQGQQVDVAAKTVDGNVLKGTFSDPLPNGEYIVNWKIVGEDGHVIERSFNFTVNIPEQSTEKDAGPDDESPSPSTPADDTPSEPANENQNEEPSNQTLPVQAPSNDNNLMMWIGAGILVLVIILGLTMRRRQR